MTLDDARQEALEIVRSKLIRRYSMKAAMWQAAGIHPDEIRDRIATVAQVAEADIEAAVEEIAAILMKHDGATVH